VTAFGGWLVRVCPLRPLQCWYTAGSRRLTARFGPDGALALNVTLGVPVLLAIGYALTWLVDRLVRRSGLPLVDPLIADWFADRRTPGLTRAALTALDVLHGSYLVAAVAVVGLALTPRPRRARADPLDVLGTAGAVAPLLILAVAADWARPDTGAAAVLPNQVTLVTASLGMLAAMLARRLAWTGAVAAWTAAVGGVVLVDGARLYAGRDWPSQVVASTLLGALWVPTRRPFPTVARARPTRRRPRVPGSSARTR
jgi:undecaprenyl-diphosphatase